MIAFELITRAQVEMSEEDYARYRDQRPDLVARIHYAIADKAAVGEDLRVMIPKVADAQAAAPQRSLWRSGAVFALAVLASQFFFGFAFGFIVRGVL